MGRDTNIQWCDDTVNPTSGCDGCELYIKPPADLSGDALKEWLRKQPCYASHLHRNRLAFSHPEKYAPDFHEVRLIPGRLQVCANWPDLTGKERPEKPWLNGMPRLIFISDMSDALSEAVSFEYLWQEVIKPVEGWQRNRHIGMWLTKRPDRLVEFARWLNARGSVLPHNLWVGTSVTTQPTANKRIPHLLRVKAALPHIKTFVSYEPARALVDFEQSCDLSPHDCSAEWLEYIDLVICGGESGSKPRPFDVAWPRAVLQQCRKAGTKFFLKQLGALPIRNPEPTGATRTHGGKRQMQVTAEVLELKDGHGGDWNEWPADLADLRVREMPEAKA